jgi:hypothetical protein
MLTSYFSLILPCKTKDLYSALPFGGRGVLFFVTLGLVVLEAFLVSAIFYSFICFEQPLDNQ